MSQKLANHVLAKRSSDELTEREGHQPKTVLTRLAPAGSARHKERTTTKTKEGNTAGPKRCSPGPNRTKGKANALVSIKT